MNLEPYLQRIRKEFPDLKFRHATFPPQGLDHVAIILDNKWVFRFPRKKKYKKLFPQEILLLEELHKRLPLSIPHYKYIARDKSFGGYALIPGDSLSREIFARVRHADKMRMQQKLAAFLSTLHAVSPALAKKRGVPVHHPRHMLFRNKEEYRKFLRPQFNNKQRRYWDMYFQQRRAHLEDPFTRVFIHHDLYVDHILIDAKRTQISGIIDFGDRALYDPARDFAILWEYGEKTVHAVYGNYQGKKDPQFLLRSRLYYQQGILNWLTAAVQKKWKTIHEPRERIREIMKMWPLDSDA